MEVAPVDAQIVAGAIQDALIARAGIENRKPGSSCSDPRSQLRRAY